MLKRRPQILLLFATLCVVLVPFRSPAPMTYTPGEGWTYEAPGKEGKWKRSRAKEQLDVAQKAFDDKDYSTSLKAARHIAKTWPLSDHAAPAQYLVGRCHEARREDQQAFDAYQAIVAKYPKTDVLKEVLQRQFEIAGRYLNGQWFRIWRYIPLPPSMDRTAGLYARIVDNGPYSDVAPQAQLKIGAAREKQKNFPEAVRAYERAADRYNDRPQIAATALFSAGMAYRKQARSPEYDQSAAGQSIATLTDFITLYPDDARVADAQKTIEWLRGEQARGNFITAKYYDKKKKPKAALIYYNEVLVHDPNSPNAVGSRQRIDEIKKHLKPAAK